MADVREEFEAWCLHGKPADAWTNWQLCWQAARRAALLEAAKVAYEKAEDWHGEDGRCACEDVGDALRALADEGMKP